VSPVRHATHFLFLSPKSRPEHRTLEDQCKARRERAQIVGVTREQLRVRAATEAVGGQEG